MERIEAGMLAVSRAGHDKGNVYAVKAADHEFVLLIDGNLRPLDKPKKKRLKHIQIIRHICPELSGIDLGMVQDEAIKRVIKQYRQSKNQPD